MSTKCSPTENVSEAHNIFLKDFLNIFFYIKKCPYEPLMAVLKVAFSGTPYMFNYFCLEVITSILSTNPNRVFWKASRLLHTLTDRDCLLYYLFPTSGIYFRNADKSLCKLSTNWMSFVMPLLFWPYSLSTRETWFILTFFSCFFLVHLTSHWGRKRRKYIVAWIILPGLNVLSLGQRGVLTN